LVLCDTQNWLATGAQLSGASGIGRVKTFSADGQPNGVNRHLYRVRGKTIMNTRRFVLHLIIGLLTFLIGVTAAIAIGGFNPMERFSRNHSRRQLTIPPQQLSGTDETVERYSGCRHNRARTADLRYYDKSFTPPPPPPVMPVEPVVVPFEEENQAPAPPTSQHATR
jgi:hypothetical protein